MQRGVACRAAGAIFNHRCSRNMHDLHELLNMLDKASLQATQITILLSKII